jgi:hypothetical protein
MTKTQKIIAKAKAAERRRILHIVRQETKSSSAFWMWRYRAMCIPVVDLIERVEKRLRGQKAVIAE